MNAKNQNLKNLDFKDKKYSLRETIEDIHKRAIHFATQHKQAEKELIFLLQHIDESRFYLRLSYPSLFQYCTVALGLSENVSYNLISVSRKSKEVPTLSEALKKNQLTLTNAKRILSVLESENSLNSNSPPSDQDSASAHTKNKNWIEKAMTLSSRALEREVAKANPQMQTPEIKKWVSEDRMAIQLGISSSLAKKLEWVQNLESQKQQKAVTLEGALEALVGFYLEKKDPVEKSRKALKGLKKKPTRSEEKFPHQMKPPIPKKTPCSAKPVARRASRTPLPTKVLHQVNLRDKRQCTFLDRRGNRCKERRWLHIHHLRPVNMGGKNTLSNLTTLCSAHHRMVHLPNSEFERGTQ